ncbi:MAG TPA: phosphate ABC transporter permease PstA [Vicinamibacteria bacterium]|nr:phosphate ABC transporter permease PstA [Vicinamibacteria bacterium]
MSAPLRAFRPREGLFRRGDPWIWLTGSALGTALLMIGGLLWIILTNGLGFFWPEGVLRLTLKDGSVWQGQLSGREEIPQPGDPAAKPRHRVQLKIGNRDIHGFDFKWIDEADITAVEDPADVAYVERREYGPFIGTPVRLTRAGQVVADGAEATWQALRPLVEQSAGHRDELRALEKDQIGAINHRLEEMRLESRRLELEAVRGGRDASAARADLERRIAEQQRRYQEKQRELEQLVQKVSQTSVTLAAATGEEKELRTLDIFRAYRPNRLTTWGRSKVYASRLWEFVSADPRESNTEGGIFPAIFGTVMMVLIMSLMAVPFGVLAALYLREYAKQGPLVRIVRIAVNNLAGVPSIVFGVFGLGFFVYLVGGSIDRLFYPEALPTPTYGTGGILWASLTLALLTVPVVIVAAEEALAAVPRSMREASLAAGATKWQTIRRVVLPAAAPGILTGLILAMARGAGEVAPLMITGVVKLAPDLPLDGFFPFFHPERKFMHLGFHIYDVGFQSPNVEAAKPMVYTTTIFLLAIVMLLNLTAILVRNRLREKYRTSAF